MYSRIKTWFEGLNRKQKNVVVTASALSLLSIMLHNPLGGYFCGKWTGSCRSKGAFIKILNNPSELFLAFSILILLGGLLLYIFRDE